MWSLRSWAESLAKLSPWRRSLRDCREDDGPSPGPPKKGFEEQSSKGAELELPAWRPGKIVGGFYRLQRPLGHGGFGVVFLAEDLATHRQVAIKVPAACRGYEVNGREILVRFANDSQAKRLLLNEVRAWMQLAHPHVVEARDFHDDESTDYLPAICLEYCNGGSLARFLRKFPDGLALPQGLDIAIQVCWALEYIHSQGILHRDLKASNVLLMLREKEPAPRALISDLGLAKVAWSPPRVELPGGVHRESSGEPVQSVLVGTPTHMAPEQWRQEGKVGPESDVYAFGVLLYEIFCGRAPFRTHILFDLRDQHCLAPRPDPRQWRPKLPKELCDLMRDCLASERERRPTTAEAEARLSSIYRRVSGRAYEEFRVKPSQVEISATARRRRAWVRVRLGIGASRRGDYAEAHREFNDAETLFRELEDLSGVAACRGNRAILLGTAGRLREADQLLSEVAEFYRQLKDPQGLARALTDRAHILAEMSHFHEAAHLLREARRYFRLARDRNNFAMSWSLLASLYWSEGKEKLARRAFRQSCVWARRVPDRQLRARIYMENGLALMKLGKLPEAMRFLRRSEKLSREIGDNSLLLACLGSQGVILRNLGLLNQALERIEEQRLLAEKLCDHVLLVRSLINQAALLIDLCQFPQALEQLSRADHLARKMQLRSELVGCLVNQALCLFAYCGDRKAALRKLDEAESQCRAAQLSELLAHVKRCRELISHSSR